MILWAVTILIGLIALLLASIGLFYLFRGTVVREVRSVRQDRIPPPADEDLSVLFAQLTNTSMVEGNEVTLLFDGDETYPAIWDALASAESLINWHVFWHRPGRLSDRLKEILIDRARAGVQVFFLKDYFGAMGVPPSYYEELEDAGVETAVFRPPSFKELYKLQHRMHARSVVVDGRIGFTGGFGIDDHWDGGGSEPGHWRDTNVRVEGPVVRQLLASFAANWAEATGQLLTGEHFFSDQSDPRENGRTAGLMFHSPSLGSTAAERMFALTIAAARETLYITTAYFVPDKHFRGQLRAATARGVDVRILTPGEHTDRPSTLYAMRFRAEEMLRDGVRIFEYDPDMIHAKTIVADGVWSFVGTVNFDNRSFTLNDEVGLVIQGPDPGRRLHDKFLEDLGHASELTLESHRKRPLSSRLKEPLAAMVSHLL